MWRLCSKIYFIGNSFWKIYEVRSERGDFNSCGKCSSGALTLTPCGSHWRGFLTFIQIAHGHTVPPAEVNWAGLAVLFSRQIINCLIHFSLLSDFRMNKGLIIIGQYFEIPITVHNQNMFANVIDASSVNDSSILV